LPINKQYTSHLTQNKNDGEDIRRTMYGLNEGPYVVESVSLRAR